MWYAIVVLANTFSFSPDPAYMAQVSDYARSVQRTQIETIRNRLSVNTSPLAQRILNDLTDLRNEIPKMRYPFEDPPN
jgi:hypothetical protein